ncbi:MAG TPA: anthranilate synthase component I family protein [Spirochaetota bacterium]|nr:anthranilate synthase component I family protein [Spirochaetota bacterium]
MIRPKKSDFLAQARPGQRFAVVHEMPADRVTPVDAFYATGASYLLESAERGMQIGRYSFLGISPDTKIEIRGTRCCVHAGAERREHEAADPLRIVGEYLRERPYIAPGDLSPLPGGAVGYIGFDMVSRWERLRDIPVRPGLGLPDAMFLCTQYNLVFDNLMHTLKIICNVETGEDLSADFDRAVDGIRDIAEQIEAAARGGLAGGGFSIGEIRSTFPRERFKNAVAHIQEMIASGEAIQVVLSQRMHAEFSGDSFAVYRALRSINPSPYMFYMDFGDFQLVGASPEVMVRIQDDRVILRPIAGTRKRGADAAEDESLKAELLADPKERAEHMMLVDLARNDLGRIAKAGTVKVDRMMEVERYSHVMHIVSEVSAIPDPASDLFDIVRAVFPAGTVSGAPKVRAMEILAQHEPVMRGPYAGMIGYFGYPGGLDSCITIRSLIVQDGKIYLQAGAGIVHDSVPEKEYEETLAKARAMFTALTKGAETGTDRH